jgi:ElaB/YqjD/DUF883 family membrane-anchored ribosome-binding protein
MPLTDEQARFYQQSLEMAKRQLEEIEQKIERELAEVRERLATMQDERNAAVKMYDAACTMLGIPNEIEPDVTEEEDSVTKPSI